MNSTNSRARTGKQFLKKAQMICEKRENGIVKCCYNHKWQEKNVKYKTKEQE